MHTYLVCFDISDDKNRRRASKYLEAHGVWVQRSVFEVSVDSTEQLTSLRKNLTKYVDRGDDLRFYHLCQSCRQKSTDLNGNRVAEFPLVLIV